MILHQKPWIIVWFLSDGMAMNFQPMLQLSVTMMSWVQVEIVDNLKASGMKQKGFEKDLVTFC